MNKTRMYYSNQRGKYGGSHFNCWGATAFVMGLVNRLYWMGEGEMRRFLREHMLEIEEKDRQRGDTLALWYQGGLEHTAVYIGNGKFFHKRGSNVSEIVDIEGITMWYYYDKAEYRRMK